MSRPPIKKERMIAAAMELFATKGLARTTVRDIAEAAGVAEGALYRHWKSKNEMAWQLYYEEVKSFAEHLRPWLEAGEGAFESRLGEAVEFIYRFYQEEPTRFVFILVTQHGFPSEKVVDDDFDPFRLVLAFLQREMRAGRIACGDPELMAALVMGAVLEPLILHRYGRVGHEPVDMADQVSARLAALLGAEGGAG